MAIDLQTVHDLKESYSEEYAQRHSDYRRLREVYQGRWWQEAEKEAQGRSITSIFRDLGRANRASLPPIRVARPIVWKICVKYQTFLSPVPMVSYYIDPPETREARAEMTAKERYTLGVWRAGQMSQRFREIAWYQPLMGDSFIGCFPDTKSKLPRPILRDPQTAYPIKGFGGDMNSGHIFHWKERASVLRATFPEYRAASERAQLGRQRSKNAAADPLDDVYEYSDGQEFARWAGETKVSGIEHGYGFDIFQHSKFIEVPGETFGHSAVEQIVNMNEIDNMIYSLLFQAVLENVFPTIVLTDPSKAPEEMLKGAGSVVTLNPGGKYEEFSPSVNALPAQLGYLANNEQSMMEAAGMPSVNFGQSPASSIVTGAAVDQLQGAATGSTIEMVQSSLGLVMSRWNEMAVHIQREMWPDDKVAMNYVTPVTAFDLVGKQGAVTVKGSDLKGGTANEIVFSPAMNQHDKLVMWLQAKGGGLVSDQYIRKQIGIPDSEAMEEEILQETLTRAVLGGITQQLTDPAQLQQVEQQGIGIIEGRRAHVPGVTPPGASSGGPAPGPGGMPPAGGQSGQPGPSGGGGVPQSVALQQGGQGLVSSPPLQLPPGSPVPGGGAPSGPPDLSQAGAQPATVNTVLQALAGIQLAGQAWLVGEIAAKGQTDGAVDVAVTDPADRETIATAAPQFQFRFMVVKGTPQEQSVPLG